MQATHENQGAFTMEPFTAAAIAQLGAVEREAQLIRLGLRYMKRSRLMKWDGEDTRRSFDIANEAYVKLVTQMGLAA